MPQVFEFHFNPKLKPDLIFDSFCYESGNIYEKRMGNLYLVGLLKNILPQNFHFLEKLAKIIQKEYYRSTIRKPEKALKECLKEANEFLEQLAKKGDVSWLGNLSFAVISLKNYELNFTKVGDLKVFLLRGKKIIDIDQKLKFEEITPWPLKIFGNIVSGKLAEGDILLVSTKEVTDFFERENLLSEIVPHQFVGEGWPVEEKKLKEIFDKHKEEALKISGLCLIIILTKEILLSKKEFITAKSYSKEFNLKEVFIPPLKFLVLRINVLLGKIFLRIIYPIFSLFTFRGKIIRKAGTALLLISEFGKKILDFQYHKLKLPKNVILVLTLIFFLGLGFLISRFQEEKKVKEHQITLEEIQKKVNRAESFLILKSPQTEKEANSLLKESFDEISQLVKIISNLPKDFQSQVFSLKDKISQTLFELNKLETVEEPELFFEFTLHQRDGKEFVPQKIIFSNGQLYFFSPYSQNLFRIDKNIQGEVIKVDQKFNFAALLDDKILFFSKPNQLSILKDQEISPFSLKEPYVDFDFESFSVLKGHLYFLDKKFGEIVKYPWLQDLKWGLPQLWLAQKEKKVIGSKSLTTDGSVWLLDKENSLYRYYTGQLQEKIVLEIFPEPKEIKKIFTSATLPQLYLLEPIQKRIIILSKTGQIIKQFQSQKFDNLIDFSVSDDGKIIWLLNGLKVYRLNFQLP